MRACGLVLSALSFAALGLLPAGEQKVAVTVRDEGFALTSYLARTVQLGEETAR